MLYLYSDNFKRISQRAQKCLSVENTKRVRNNMPVQNESQCIEGYATLNK